MSGNPGRLFGLALASIALIGPLAVHLFIPVMPAIKAALGLSDALSQLTFSISLFGMAFATLVYGSLADRYGRRPVLLSGLCLFLVGSALSLMAESIVPLAIGRLVQAIGAGCGMTLVRAIARDAYDPTRLVQVIAYLTMFYTLGPMVSPIVGGLLVDSFGWRSVFIFSLAGGAAIAAAAYFVIYETRPSTSTTRATTSVLRDYGELFSHARFTAFITQTGFNSACFLVNATAASFLMKETLGRSASEYGFWFAVFPGGFFLGNLVSSRLAARASTESMVFAGSAMVICVVIVQAGLLLSGHVTPWTIFIPGFFVTFAQGISLAYAQVGAMAVSPRIAGTAAGLGVCMQNLIGALFAQLYGFVADGTVWPMAMISLLSATLGLVAGTTPLVLKRSPS